MFPALDYSPRMYKHLLLVVVGLVAGCGSGGGSASPAIEVRVGCAGAACGETGTLRLTVKPNDCSIEVLYIDAVPGVTLGSGSQVAARLDEYMDAGATYCVEVFLDVNDDILRTNGVDYEASGLGQVTTAKTSSPTVLTFEIDTLIN